MEKKKLQNKVAFKNTLILRLSLEKNDTEEIFFIWLFVES